MLILSCDKPTISHYNAATDVDMDSFRVIGHITKPYIHIFMLLTLCMLGNFAFFWCCLLTFFKINFFKKFFQEHYQSVKRFVSRSGPTFCRSRSGSKLFAKVSVDDKNCHKQGKS